MLRKVLAWSALIAFALLNVGGEALHHAEFLGFHSHGAAATSCGCAFHRAAPEDEEQDGDRVESHQQACDHDCPLCQYYALTNPTVADLSDICVDEPRGPDAVVTLSSTLNSGLVLAWFARGPPLA